MLALTLASLFFLMVLYAVRPATQNMGPAKQNDGGEK